MGYGNWWDTFGVPFLILAGMAVAAGCYLLAAWMEVDDECD